MSNKAQFLGYRVGAVACPILAVVAFQFVQGEPASAHAGVNDIDFRALPVVPEHTVESTHTALSARNTVSPFWFEELKVVEPTLPEYVPPSGEIDTPDPTFVLSAVLPSANKSFAVVNGKPYSVGDYVVADWELVKIAGQDRYIIMEHSSGKRLRIKMNR
ncbi:MAG: hypothetical protein P1U30_00915 [Phycisphaerales bacterium]|nr:hypothetical protein [Phycisphaerales bacterium]